MQDLLPLDARDRLLVKTPITFDASVIEYFWPLIAGAALVVARPDGHKDSRYLVDTIEAEAATVLQVVPSMLHLLVGEPGLARCPSLRYLLAGGEELTRELQEAFFARSGADLVNFYGPTETAVNATAWVCRRDDDPRPVPIGFPAANSYTFALDRFGRPVPVGVSGAAELTAAELTALVKQRLPEYMVPSAFVFLPQLPILPNGKVDRNALPAPALSRPELDSAYVAPRDPVERSIAEIWARLLGI